MSKSNESDVLWAVRLAYILESRGLLTPKDISYLDGALSFADWKKYNSENKDWINGRFVAKNLPEEVEKLLIDSEKSDIVVEEK